MVIKDMGADSTKNNFFLSGLYQNIFHSSAYLHQNNGNHETTLHEISAKIDKVSKNSSDNKIEYLSLLPHCVKLNLNDQTTIKTLKSLKGKLNLFFIDTQNIAIH